MGGYFDAECLADVLFNYMSYNLVPRVFKLFGQRGNAGKTLGTSKKFNFFDWLLRNGFRCFTAEILR